MRCKFQMLLKSDMLLGLQSKTEERTRKSINKLFLKDVIHICVGIMKGYDPGM
jgi:hypothetical protein